ncbi:Wzy polymerase domain-containing protein [Sphaerotilaceae bacterium SBD11-9]
MQSVTNQPPLETAWHQKLSLAARTLAPLAVTLPVLLAYNAPPSATFLNQALAFSGWGLWMAWLLAPMVSMSARAAFGKTWPMLTALGLLALSALVSMSLSALPSSVSLSSVGTITSAILVLVFATTLQSAERSDRAYAAFCIALLAAGFISLLIALIQYFAPLWADGNLIARIATPGRVGGNLRQPNHLSSLLLWALVALVWLHDARVETLPTKARVPFRWATALLMVGFVFGVVLTVSRTGTTCILLLAVWGAVDKRLSRFLRGLLWVVPLAYVLCWMGASEWAQMGGSQVFAGGEQLHKSDPSSSRFAIWANTLELIKQNPWFGVGWGEFNFAWTLTPFPGRPVAFFDHTHNLPLQFLVELGIPLGTLVLALLAWALWKAFTACRTAGEPDRPMVRTAFVMVLMMVVHSMLEYPLWYAYFLLPTAFAFGICLGHSEPAATSTDTPASPWLRRGLIAASLALCAGTLYSVFDYTRVTAIFATDEDMPLSYRIARGQKSVFFAHHADYAAATVTDHPSTVMKAFRRAPHYLLDTRLMIAWATAYAEKGDVERARYVAERLREFRNPDAAEFFAECDKPYAAGEPKPFQCTPSTQHFTYEDFKLR